MRKILILFIFAGCASYLGIPTLEKSNNTLVSYFHSINKKDTKRSYKLLMDNITYGTDGYGKEKSNGFVVQVGDENKSILTSRSSFVTVGDQERFKGYVKTFIKESLIIDKCGTSKNSKSCFIKTYADNFKTQNSIESQLKKHAESLIKLYCSVPCDWHNDICLVLSSKVGEKWGNGQKFLNTACGE